MSSPAKAPKHTRQVRRYYLPDPLNSSMTESNHQETTFMKKLLKQLTETFGPSGYEENIRKLVRAEIKSLADELKVDSLGNLIARKRPAKYTKDTKKIMVAAHMD